MPRWLRISGFVVAGLLAVLAIAIPAAVGIRPIIGPKTRPLTDRQFERTPARLERGRYLATAVAGCVYCHGELDWESPGFPMRPETEGGGRSWADEGLPWLTAPNITPDQETGVGAWTDDMLARAIREGISQDGRALFPVMPYHQYRQMSDEDLASVVVYIRSLPPLSRTLPPTELPFPLNRLINSMPEPVTEPVAAPDTDDPIAYGDYLVRLGACRDCHTPTDAQGQAIAGMEFAGGFILLGPYGEVASPNITPAASGIPYYTEELFLQVMRTGYAQARKIHDAMPWAAYGQQTDADLEAMFAYVTTLAPVAHRVDNTLPPTECRQCGNRHGAGDQNRTESD